MNGFVQRMNQGIVYRTVEPIQLAIDQWLASHWWVNFLVHHPLVLLGVVLLIVFLVSGALRAISRTSESLWILALKLPFRLLGWLGVRSLAWWRKNQQDEKGDRLNALLTRLEVLQEEQDAILAEVKTLVQGAPQQPQHNALAKMRWGVGDGNRPQKTPKLLPTPTAKS
jgi:cell division protein FtsB